MPFPERTKHFSLIRSVNENPTRTRSLVYDHMPRHVPQQNEFKRRQNTEATGITNTAFLRCSPFLCEFPQLFTHNRKCTKQTDEATRREEEKGVEYTKAEDRKGAKPELPLLCLED